MGLCIMTAHLKYLPNILLLNTYVDDGLQALTASTPVRPSRPAAAAARALPQRPWHTCRLRALQGRSLHKASRRRSSGVAAAPRAMVNVDFSPALVLGLGMVAGGLLLYNVRLSRPWISRDYDVVISSISILTGGILVFQVRRAQAVGLSQCHRCARRWTVDGGA